MDEATPVGREAASTAWRARCAALVAALVGAVFVGLPGDVARGGEPSLPAPVPCPGCWHPAGGTTWQVQFAGTFDPSIPADAYDIDLFDSPASRVTLLHDRGRRAVCYINAGAWEDWRPDADRYPAVVKGKPLDGWPGERWLDIRRQDILRPILRDRLDRCRAKGFDGVEFDNVDGYANASGFPLGRHDQLTFNAWLANAAHRRGLAVGLKNDLDQVPRLLPYFDFAIVEQCFTYRECWRTSPFVDAGRAVLVIEYDLPRSAFCDRAGELGLYAMRKRLALDAWRRSC